MKLRVATMALFGAALLAVTPGVSSAQERLVHVNFGGGPTFMGGDLGSHFKTGWGPAVGVTVDSPSHKFGAQFEYAYRWFGLNDSLDAKLGVLDANHQTHQMDFNLVYNLTSPDHNSFRGYLIAGPGAYYRKVEITKYEGTGVICDPYWYICGAYPVSSVLGSRGGWDFGFNVGGGVGFKVGEESEIYVESRFHYVIGPDIQSNVAGVNGGSTHGYYFPLTFGFRF